MVCTFNSVHEQRCVYIYVYAYNHICVYKEPTGNMQLEWINKELKG